MRLQADPIWVIWKSCLFLENLVKIIPQLKSFNFSLNKKKKGVFSLFCWIRCTSAAQLLCHVWLVVTPMDGSPPGSSVHGTLQARILAWVTISYSGGSSQLRAWTCISVSLASLALAGGFLTTEPQWEAHLLLKSESERVSHSVMSDSSQPHGL